MSDFPDDFGIPQYPKFGPAARAIYSNVVGASGYTTLFTVAGQGVCYGARIAITGTGIINNDTVKIEIDGSEVSEQTLTSIFACNDVAHADSLMGITLWNALTFECAVTIRSGLTFISSLALKYKESYGRTPAVLAYMYYALVG